MPLPVAGAVAIGAAGVAALGAIGLKLRANLAAKKAAPVPANVPPSPPSPPANGPVVAPPPPQVAAALPALVSNPDGSPRTEGTPFIFGSNSDAAAAVAEANRRGISVQQLLLERSGQLAKTDGVAVQGQKAIVTTNDPAPSGDLIIRSAPSATAGQIGGAEKNGTVTVLDSSDATFAKIQWSGGPRWPACTGFARKAYLKLV